MQLALVGTNAALPPQLYWKSMLPTTPMPKAITNLLHPGQYSSSKGTYSKSHTHFLHIWNVTFNCSV